MSKLAIVSSSLTILAGSSRCDWSLRLARVDTVLDEGIIG
jgi:hypothetical protein